MTSKPAHVGGVAVALELSLSCAGKAEVRDAKKRLDGHTSR